MQYTSVLVYKCPPTPLHPLGRIVPGYHLTLNWRVKGSPIETRACLVWADTEYAAAASMVPGATAFGAAWTRRFRALEMWRWESWRVPARAMMRGV
jgi:hypothetical protein